MGLKPSDMSGDLPGEAHMLSRGSLLIAGIPATGKSTIGDWLEGQQGYLHLDEDRVVQRGFGAEQQLLWHQQQGEPLHQALLARQQPIVITWGFAPQFLPTVRHVLIWGLSRSGSQRHQRLPGGPSSRVVGSTSAFSTSIWRCWTRMRRRS